MHTEAQMQDNSSMKSIVLAILLCASSVFAADRLITVLPTGSMEPTLHGGDVLTVEAVPFNSLRVGDIIVFCDPRQKPQKIVHRIVEIRRGKLWTKGDANFRRDAFWVMPSHVVGRVKEVRRGS